METQILNFGSFIKSKRTNQKIKQKIFAEDIQISATYLSLVENNKVKPSLQLLRTISERFSMEFEDMVLEVFLKDFRHELPKNFNRKQTKKILRNIFFGITQ